MARKVKPSEPMRIVYDCTLKRPGCALLQAFGGTVPSDRFAMLFDNKDWLFAPTPDMKTYQVTEDQLERVAKITRERGRAETKKSARG